MCHQHTNPDRKPNTVRVPIRRQIALDRIDALSCVGPYSYHSIDRYHRPIDLFLSYWPTRNCVLDPNCSRESIAACASRLITGPLIAGRNGEAHCNTPQPNNKNQASRELWQERNRSSRGGPRPTADRFRRDTVRPICWEAMSRRVTHSDAPRA
jgi:hypothetical protein